MIRIERFSSDIQMKLEDFINSGWEDAFQGDAAQHLAAVADRLAKKGQKALEEGKTSQSKALWLVADACSMMLQPSSFNEPFKPYFISRSGRSSVPDDFSEQDLGFFSIILPSISNHELKGRLSDLIWLKNRSKIDLALDAIDSYTKSPISLASFLETGAILGSELYSLRAL